MEEIVYLNGRLLPRSQAKISPLEYGFLYGYGLFETLRAYQGWVFRWEQHLCRLKSSAKMVGLNSLRDNWNLGNAVYDTLQANRLTDARLRLTVSGGEGETMGDISICQQSTILIIAKSYTPYPAKVYHQGLAAILSSIQRNSQSPLSRVKSTNYLENLLAHREAKAKGADEALLLNERGFLTEGSRSNIFLVSQGILLTPDLESGILPGITREAVLEISSAIGIESQAGKIPLSQLQEAEEAFLTNSLWEIMPLTRIAEKTIGAGRPGKITRRLAEAYTKMVEKERLGSSAKEQTFKITNK